MLVAVLLTVPVLAIFFLGHRTTTPSPALKHYLATTDIGPATTPPLGPDGVPAALHATAPGDGQVVSQESAHQIIEDAWALRLTAIKDHNSALLAKFETGVQLDADRNDCGCNPPPGTRIRSWSASATRQTSYPEFFIGQVVVHIAGADDFDLMAFRRDAADQPWKLDALTGTMVTPNFEPPLTGAPASLDLDTDPDGLPVNPPVAVAEADEMNAYWQYWATHGSEKPGSYLSAGYGALTDLGKANIENIQIARSAGVRLVYRYNDDSPFDGPSVFPGTAMPGSAISCGGTSYTAIYTPIGSERTFHQSTGNGAAVDPELLPRGDYRKVVVEGYRPWCLVTSSDHRVWSAIGFTGKKVVQAVR